MDIGSLRLPAPLTLALALGVLVSAAPAVSENATPVGAYGWSAWSYPLTIVYPAAPPAATAPTIPPGASSALAPAAAGKHAAKMTVALNAGGWGPSAYFDVAGAARAVRLESRFANDAELEGAASAGVTVATWVFGTGGSIGSIDPEAYAAEVVALFKRYGRGGTFWQGRTDLGGQAVEVLNEPGGGWFWRDPANYAAYTDLLRVVHETLAREFPEAIRPRVLASWDGGAGRSSRFGQGWKALGGLDYCDGVTVHPYGGSEGQAGGEQGDRPAVARAHAASGKPVYVTEVGWPTAVGAPSTGDSQQWTEAQQAQSIASFIDWARATRYVAMVVIFGLADYEPTNWYGIERLDRTHKLSYTALAATQGLAPAAAGLPAAP
jgi:hypothetical protein